jgi:protein-disulfide isomerase
VASEEARSSGADRPPDSGDQDYITIRLPRALIYGVVGVVAGVVVGFLLGRATDGGDPDTVAATADRSTPAIAGVRVAGRPSRGPENAKVTVVEFTDYECPFCKRHFNETYHALLDEYEGRIRYVVRNFPIATIHPSAPKAAEAAECAFEQGKFWEYHDGLFGIAASLDVESLKQQATNVGLDRGRFDQCVDSGAKAQVVREDIEDGRRYGVTGTPTFFINGEKLVGARSLDGFRQIIDDKLR